MRKGIGFIKESASYIRDSRKWIVIYVLLIVIPASYLFYGYQQRSIDMLEEEIRLSMQQTIKQSALNLDSLMERMKSTSDSLSMSANLYDILRQSDHAYPVDVMRNLKALIEVAETNVDVFKVRLFLEGDGIFSRERINIFPIDDLAGEEWYNDVVNAQGSVIWKGVYNEYYIGQSHRLVFSNARMLRDPNQFNRFVGVLVVDWNEEVFRQIIESIQLTENQMIYIVDRHNQVVWHPDIAEIGNIISSELIDILQQGFEGSSQVSTGKEQRTLLYTSLNIADWKLVAEIPKQAVFTQARQLNQTTSIVILMMGIVLILLLIFVVMLYVVREMNRSVQGAIHSIQRERLNVSIGSQSTSLKQGKFNALEQSVDYLVHKVRRLMEESYLAKNREREAQLRALQAQINPHFLYNTLDMINWIAVERKAYDISQMITQLAKYFRLSLNKGLDRVPLGDELELIKTYLDLQQIRFSSSFSYTIDVEEQAMTCIVPKLTLQPIVENALLHGIRKVSDGTIHIKAKLIDDDLLLVIEDNGLGMDETVLKRLLIEPQKKIELLSSSSYGLFNVHERIKMFSGDQYGVSVTSSIGKGTSVEVRLKAQ